MEANDPEVVLRQQQEAVHDESLLGLACEEIILGNHGAC